MDIRPLIRKEVAVLKAYEIEDVSARVKLDAMENPYALPEDVRKEIAFAIADAPVNLYPDPQAKGLKAALSEYIGVPADRLLLGNGSDELIGLVISAFGGSPGLIAYPAPTFSMYGIIARSLGQETMELPTTDDFGLDFDGSLKMMMDRRPKVIFIANPNNPTGNLFDRDKVRRLIKGSGAVVVVDEAYYSFSGETFINELDEHPNLIVMRTLSKIGMAGLRVGIMAASREILTEVNKVRLPYNLNTLSQTAATIILKHGEVIDCQVKLIVKEREKLFASLSALDGVTAYPSKTNFILFRVSGASRIFEALKDKGILIRNMDSPGRLANCLRVTVGTPEQNAEFVAELKKMTG
ncbi:MAG: histidinol-phosphate transaminase [Nitrospirae bacterium]|nr:histidinol-phosphate transaminase [Nitrospirota bacterium]